MPHLALVHPERCDGFRSHRSSPRTQCKCTGRPRRHQERRCFLAEGSAMSLLRHWTKRSIMSLATTFATCPHVTSYSNFDVCSWCIHQKNMHVRSVATRPPRRKNSSFHKARERIEVTAKVGLHIEIFGGDRNIGRRSCFLFSFHIAADVRVNAHVALAHQHTENTLRTRIATTHTARAPSNGACQEQAPRERRRRGGEAGGGRRQAAETSSACSREEAAVTVHLPARDIAHTSQT